MSKEDAEEYLIRFCKNCAEMGIYEDLQEAIRTVLHFPLITSPLHERRARLLASKVGVDVLELDGSCCVPLKVANVEYSPEDPDGELTVYFGSSSIHELESLLGALKAVLEEIPE